LVLVYIVVGILCLAIVASIVFFLRGILRALFHLCKEAAQAIRRRIVMRRTGRNYGKVRVYPRGHGQKRRVDSAREVLHDFGVAGPAARTWVVFHRTDPERFFKELQQYIAQDGLRSLRVSMKNGVIVLSSSGHLADWQHDMCELLYFKERQSARWNARLGEAWVEWEAAEQRARRTREEARSQGHQTRPARQTAARNDRLFRWNGRVLPRCLYGVLEVDPRARQVAIERAYRALMQECHPDHGGDTEAAIELNNAYEVLRDPAARHLYNVENGYSSGHTSQK
jgi:DnaJ domain